MTYKEVGDKEGIKGEHTQIRTRTASHRRQEQSEWFSVLNGTMIEPRREN